MPPCSAGFARRSPLAGHLRAWVTDITHVRTGQGWLHLAVVRARFSRKVVGWAACPTIDRDLVLDAVLMAGRARRPRGTLIQSDQGRQFGSDAWRRFCRSHHLEPNMSSQGPKQRVLYLGDSSQRRRARPRIALPDNPVLQSLTSDSAVRRRRNHAELGLCGPGAALTPADRCSVPPLNVTQSHRRIRHTFACTRNVHLLVATRLLPVVMHKSPAESSVRRTTPRWPFSNARPSRGSPAVGLPV